MQVSTSRQDVTDTTSGQRTRSILLRGPVIFAATFICIFLLHARLLSLPYFWDEAGYYVPAARDLLLTGSLIPHTTISNAHPPLVMAWLAAWWKGIGYAPMVTRTAMLVVAAFSLLGVFRLARRVANLRVAMAATVCTALYPVFFAQSSLAQVDLAAAGLTFWGLTAYLEDRPVWVAVWFSLAALAKETAILTPAALATFEVVPFFLPRLRSAFVAGDETKEAGASTTRFCAGRAVALVVPVIPLVAWYAYHYSRTGYVFGNPEFFRYNVAATLNVPRFFLAFWMRIWQVFGYLDLWILTGGMLAAMLLPPVVEGGRARPRISVPVQVAFAFVIAAYVIVMAAVGGAVLARYMLPATPLVIILAVSTLWRRLKAWPIAIGIVGLGFVLGWFWNPPYGFAPEDNLAYADYVRMHQEAERFLETHYATARVLTAWPASDELTRPWLGYTTRPVQIVRVEDFSVEEVLSAAEYGSNFEAALVFSTKYEPAHALLGHWRAWEKLKTRFFNFHRDLPPGAIAHILGGRIVFATASQGQWVAIIERGKGQELEDARLR